jgi:hypothetical protein
MGPQLPLPPSTPSCRVLQLPGCRLRAGLLWAPRTCASRPGLWGSAGYSSQEKGWVWPQLKGS